MLTFRRGVARVGWILLAMWVALWAYLLVVVRSQSDNPPPMDAPLALQVAAYVVGGPLVVFLCWRLLLWIGQGFWQPAEGPGSSTSARGASQLSVPGWTPSTMVLFGAVLFAFVGAATGLGGLLANVAIGAIFGGLVARFLPNRP